MADQPCAYANHRDNPATESVACFGQAVFTIHDARGCVRVCFKHLDWRLKKSFLYGHSASCPERPK